MHGDVHDDEHDDMHGADNYVILSMSDIQVTS